MAHGVRRLHRSDTLSDILDSPDRGDWIDWLRHRPLALHAHGWLMVHAGVAPQWDLATTLALAGEVQDRLRSSDLHDFLQVMYGNQPDRWSDDLQGNDRLRFAVNTLTRIRFVDRRRPARHGVEGRRGRCARPAWCPGSTPPGAAPPASPSPSATGRPWA